MLPRPIRASATALCFALCALVCLAQDTPVDLIWSARYIATADDEMTVIEDGALAIEGDHIVAVGTRAEVEAQYEAARHIDQPNAILAPGLINTHTHAAMSLFRGIANDMVLEDWLNNFIFPAEAKNVDRDFVRWGTRLALLEMARSGTTSFVDMYYFEDTVAEETAAAGLRGILSQTIIGFPSPDYATPQLALEGTRKFLNDWKDHNLIIPAVGPHAIYTTPDDILRASRELANEFDAPLHIHLAETETEYNDALRERGMTPTETLAKLGLLDGTTIAAHSVWLSDEDIALLASHGAGVAHNPSSNMMLASGVARVPDLLKAGIAVGLGTDGPAGSNNDFDMFEEMDLAAKLQKVSTRNPVALSAKESVAMATRLGAEVIGMGDRIGSLEPGKLADIISVDISTPRATPLYEVHAQLVYALKGSDVTDVMVNGKMIVEGRKVLTINEAPVLKRADQYHDQILRSLAN